MFPGVCVYRIPVPSATYPRIDAQQPPERLEPHEKMRVRAAAFRVKKVYPGPAGEVLARELMAWEEFGFRFHRAGLVAQLIEQIEDAPL